MGRSCDFSLTQGLRRGEAVGLRVSEADLNRSRETVHENAARVGDAIIVGSLKSPRVRTVPLPAFVAAALDDVVDEEALGALVSVTASRTPGPRTRGLGDGSLPASARSPPTGRSESSQSRTCVTRRHLSQPRPAQASKRSGACWVTPPRP